jgi:hypothetical protein
MYYLNMHVHTVLFKQFLRTVSLNLMEDTVLVRYGNKQEYTNEDLVRDHNIRLNPDYSAVLSATRYEHSLA